MNERIRFYLDEDIDSDVAKVLRRQDIDVVTTSELGLRGQSDKMQLAIAHNGNKLQSDSPTMLN